MSFNEDGYLPAGIHYMETEELKARFVDEFYTSSSRPKIFEGYLKHKSELLTLGIDVEQLLDGSFISAKLDPGDIDLVCFADADEVDQLPPEKQELLLQLVSGKVTRETHQCDAYFCPTFPSDDPRYPHFRQQRKYWMGEFGFDRQDKPKGVVRSVIKGGQV